MPLPPTPADVEAAARLLRGRVRTTPVLELGAGDLAGLGPLLLKLEHLQHSGSFKARGALHALLVDPPGPAGVVAASGGNHGAAVAWAAAELGVSATVFVPTIASPAKVDRLRAYGATVHQVGQVYADALAASRAHQVRTGACVVHAYDDPRVVAGAGTTARELHAQAGPIDAVLVACGGGGLSGGMAAWLGDRTRVVVCETEGTATFAAALAAGGPADVVVTGVAADALGATRLGETGWAALRENGAESAVVADADALAARELLWDRLRLLVEPAAAVPLAVLLTRRWVPRDGQRVAVLLCGANTAR